MPLSAIDGWGKRRYEVANTDEPNATVAEAIAKVKVAAPVKADVLGKPSAPVKPKPRPRPVKEPRPMVALRDEEGHDRMQMDARSEKPQTEYNLEGGAPLGADVEVPESRKMIDEVSKQKYERPSMFRMLDKRGTERMSMDAEDEDPAMEEEAELVEQGEGGELTTAGVLPKKQSKGKPKSGLTLRDADGIERVDFTTPSPYMDQETLKLQKDDPKRELSPDEVHKAMDRPMIQKPLMSILDPAGQRRVTIDAQPERNETEVDQEEVAPGLLEEDLEITTEDQKKKKKLKPVKPRNGLTMLDGFGKERAVIETTDEPDVNTTAVRDPPPRPGRPSRPSITHPPCLRCLDGSGNTVKPRPKPKPKPIMQFKDPRGVERVAVDANEDEEDEEAVLTGEVDANSEEAVKPTRRPGLILRDSYGKPRVEMATESEKNLTTDKIVTQRLAEAEAIEKGEPMPKRPAAEKPSFKPLMRVRDEGGVERLSLDAREEDETEIESEAADDAAEKLIPKREDAIKGEPLTQPTADEIKEKRSKYKLSATDMRPSRSGLKLNDRCDLSR